MLAVEKAIPGVLESGGQNIATGADRDHPLETRKSPYPSRGLGTTLDPADLHELGVEGEAAVNAAPMPARNPQSTHRGTRHGSTRHHPILQPGGQPRMPDGYFGM